MKTVVITGASTGIGRATALRLDAFGWRVFGCVRTETDRQNLQDAGSSNLFPLLLDVTDEGSIGAAAAAVAEQTSGRLDALVNNVGIARPVPLEHLSVEELRTHLETNAVGHLACTQAFLPLLRKQHGRIVFVSTIQTRVPVIPTFGPYCASKAAQASIAETLGTELRSSGIEVVLVEPGTIRTSIWTKAEKSLIDSKARLSETGREAYGETIERAVDLTQVARKVGRSPEEVARVIERALSARRPRRRYHVGDALARIAIEKLAPTPLRDRIIGLGVRGIASSMRSRLS